MSIMAHLTAVRVYTDKSSLIDHMGTHVTHLNNVRVRCDEHGLLDPNGTNVCHIMNARVLVEEDHIWDGFGFGGNCSPTYAAPTFFLNATPIIGEVGTASNIAVTPMWLKNDAGSPTNYQLTLTGSTTYTTTTPANYSFPNVLFEDTVKELKGKVSYQAGLIKDDNEGNPYPTGAIAAGTLESNTIKISGYRSIFYKSFNSQVASPTTSAEIRDSSWGRINDIGDTKSFTLAIPSGTKDVIFCTPVSFGNNITVYQASLGKMFSIAAAFTANQSVVNVEGANSYAAIPYNVFHMTNAAGYPGKDSFEVQLLP
jgi:hypothetical protein